MNNEIWKPIKSFENYEISNFGNVRSLNYNKTKKIQLLHQYVKKGGYKQVSLNKNNVQYFKSVHRLVAEAYLNKKDFKSMPDEDKKIIDFKTLEVNHKDENKQNNRVDNLEWCTKKYNKNYGTAIARAKPKISKKNKGKHFSPQTEFKKGDNARKIKCIELNKKFNSIIEASLELNICATNIVNVCKHKKHNKTAGGYHFEYD